MAGFEGILSPQVTEGTQSVDGKKTSSETASTPKSGPSLFDSMLAQVSGNTSTQEEANSNPSSQNTKIQTSPENKEANKTTMLTSSDEVVSQDKTATKSTETSLFDKMVSQTKTSEQKTQSGPTSTPVKEKGVSSTSIESELTSTGEKLQSNTTSGKKTYTVSPTLIEETTAQSKNINTEAVEELKTSASNNSTTAQKKLSNPLVTDTKSNITNTSETLANVSKKSESDGSKSVLSQEGDKKPLASAGSTAQNIELNTKTSQESDTLKTTNTNSSKVEIKNTNNSVRQPEQQAVKQSAVATTSNPINENTDLKQTKSILNNTQEVTKEEKTSSLIVKNNVSKLQNTKEINQNPKIIASQETSKSLSQQETSSKAPSDEKIKKGINPEQIDEKTAPKRSLADQLIANATQTAAKTNPLKTQEAQKLSTEKNVAENTITTPLGNTKVVKSDSPESLGQTDTKVAKSKVTQTIGTQENLSEKIDTKISEQNIIDKKLDNKTTEIKSIDKESLLDKHEQNKIEKLVNNTTSATVSNTTSSSNNITNNELANQLATIRDNAKGEVSTLGMGGVKSELQNTSIKKDDLLNQAKKQNNTNSLLDKMVEDSSGLSQASDSDDASLGTKDQFVQKDLPLFATAGYLQDQKRRNDIANMMKKHEGVLQAQNAKGVSDIKKSAATLELNATETEVVKEAVQKEEARVQNTREGILKRLAFDNHIDKKLHNNTQQLKDAELVVTKASTLTNTSEEKVVEVAVANEAVQTIENRIIGARQSLRTMMSDVARQMAQNYRPPLTAFRINLNPSGLGNIAVMIKSEQNNGVNISLNMSNTNTHDTLVDNQAALRAALTRNFESNTSFNLNFGMQQDSNNQSNQNQDGKSNQNQDSSDRTISANNMNEETSEEAIAQQASYM